MSKLSFFSKMMRLSFATPLPVRFTTPCAGLVICAPRASLSTATEIEPNESTEQVEERPGLLDATRGFKEGKSVEFWRHFDASRPGSMQQLLKDLRTDSSESSRAAGYYMYCLGRTLYFSMQGLLGSEIHRIRSGRKPVGLSARNINASASLVEAGYVFRDDWSRISQGMYRLPWDASLRHRQNRPLRMLHSAGVFVQNAVDTLSRRNDPNGADTNVWLDSPSFPDYYRSTFHFQRDGWLSTNSADAYEISTETLFIGRQDAMQRLALIGLHSALQTQNSRPQILEVGAGTGRLATFILDNYPNCRYTISDLSAFYLAKARDNVEYWNKFTKRRADVKYLQAPAENLSIPSESQHIVIASYLFHELPPDARRNALNEAWRVLEPGGQFIFVDSIQFGDRLNRDGGLDRFVHFNEPWYGSYVREDFGALCSEIGFQPGIKEVSSVTKLLTFKKPKSTTKSQVKN